MLFTFYFSLFTLIIAASSFAQEKAAINSNSLDYDGKTFTYTAKGDVRLERGNVKVQADEIVYNEQSAEVLAEGNVRYEDPRVVIRARKAEVNLELKTGVLYDGEIDTKKDNYHIKSSEIEQTGEDEYTLRSATFTTCDAPLPAWCFKGSQVDAIVGERLKAKNVTFTILGLPVLYSPYFTSSLGNERKTGLLSPSIGYIKSKGIHAEESFYWAISENRDATFVLDGYGRRGIGEGLEYRFLEPDKSKGNLWVYHLRDRKLDEDFWDVRALYDRDRESPLTAYLNLNYINSRLFYSEYNPYIITKTRGIDSASYLNFTTSRFLESQGEVSMRFDNSRLFLTSQYLVDLKTGVDSSAIAQRLPEVGYFVNPQRVGPVVFSLASHLSNFYREGGASGQRLDVYPKFTHSFGEDFVFTQALGLRETAYLLTRSEEFGNSPHRESLDYTFNAQTRLVKKYASIMHILEPSIGYTYIPPAESNLPLFDSTELYKKTSSAQVSLLNRFIDRNGEFLTVRITQPYDINRDDHHLLPIRLEAAIQRPIAFRGETSYDFNTGRVEDVNSDLYFQLPGKAMFKIGERYNRQEDILFFTIGGSYTFTKSLSAEGSFWYDGNSKTVRDIMAKVKYQKQCWGISVVGTKSQLNGSQSDYSISVLFDLLGLGTIKL